LLGADFPNTVEGTMVGIVTAAAEAAAVFFRKVLRFMGIGL
jgi:hypothetical protein